MEDSLSLTSLRLLYYRYKDTPYYPIVNVGILLLIGSLLLFQVLLPQFSEWFSVQREVATLKKNIKTMQENAAFLAALDQQSIDEDVQTVASAYPFSNDYAGIINALNQTASRTGIALPSFSIAIGDISATGPAGTPASYTLSLGFAASLETAKKFVDELNKTLPLSGIPEFSNDQGSTTVDINFYYHGFPQVTINQKEKLTPLSAEEQGLLSQMKTWRVSSPDVIGEGEVLPVEVTSSSSANFPPPL